MTTTATTWRIIVVTAGIFELLLPVMPHPRADAQVTARTIDSMLAVLRSPESGDTDRVSLCISLYNAAQTGGRMDVLIEAADSALSAARRLRRPVEIARALLVHGNNSTLQGDFESGIAEIREAVEILEKYGDWRLAGAYSHLAIRLARHGHAADALEPALRAADLHAARGDSSFLANDWNLIGIIHHDLGNMSKAADYFSRCMNRARRQGDRKAEAMALMNLANTMSDHEQDKAAEYYGQGAEYFRSFGDMANAGHALVLKGTALRKMLKMADALAALEEGVALIERHPDMQLRLMALNSLALLYEMAGMRDLALRTRENHLNIARATRSDVQVAQSLVNLASIELHDRASVDAAYEKMQEAMPILLKKGQKGMIVGGYEILRLCEEARGDSAAAYRAFMNMVEAQREMHNMEARRHIDSLAAAYDLASREQRIELLEKEQRINALALSDRENELLRHRLIAGQRERELVILEQRASIRDLELAAQTARLAAQKAETDKREKDLRLAKAEGAMQASQLESKTYQRNALLAGIVLLMVTVAFIVHRLRGRRREAALRAEAAESETLRVAALSERREKEAQRTFTKQLMQSQENERQRIARELHDGLSQSLLLIRNRALMGLRSQSDPETAAAQLREISGAAAESLDDVRAISRDLRPTQLERAGLTQTLRSTLEAVEEASDVRFTVEIADLDGVVAPEDEINIFRIIQEGVNNILKHAQAREALVLVTRDADELRIAIEDDGMGFDTLRGNGDGGHGFGLQGMVERARMLTGTVTVDSAPGTGTLVLVTLPLPGAAQAPEGPPSAAVNPDAAAMLKDVYDR